MDCVSLLSPSVSLGEVPSSAVQKVETGTTRWHFALPSNGDSDCLGISPPNNGSCVFFKHEIFDCRINAAFSLQPVVRQGIAATALV